MKARLWKRLGALQTQLSPDNNFITVRQRPGESAEQTEARLERWRQGEDDREISAQPRNGNEIVVILRSFLGSD